MTDHPFWAALLWLCLAWYSTITVYVAFRGFAEIRRLLRHLGGGPPAGDN